MSGSRNQLLVTLNQLDQSDLLKNSTNEPKNQVYSPKAKVCFNTNGLNWSTGSDVLVTSNCDRIKKFIRQLLQGNATNRHLLLEALCRATLNQIDDNNVKIHEHQKSTEFLSKSLTTLLRLSLRCPIPSIKEDFQGLMADIQRKGIHIPPVINKSISSFIPNKEIPSDKTPDNQTYDLFMESFANTGRLEHIVMVMGMHSSYLCHYLNTTVEMFKAEGSLPTSHRYYIAIMAAARHRCPYLVHLMEDKFLESHGDPEWLEGIDHVPPKLQALSTLNKHLAHRPWMVVIDHIKRIIEGERDYRWQIQDLVQAIVILCHFHALAVFCHSVGINLEIDHDERHVFPDLKVPVSRNNSPRSGSMHHCTDRPKSPVARHQVGELLKKMKDLSQEGAKEQMTEEEHFRWFEREKSEADRHLFATDDVMEASQAPTNHASYRRFIHDPDFTFEEFRNCAPTFRALDYNWDDHACGLLSEMDENMAILLDNKFKITSSLTYKTLAFESDVDTSSLRRAVWNYIHCMYGIMYDDYNYGEIHHLLERPLKKFIRIVSSVPESTTKELYDDFWRDFRHSEKVHVSILLMEARLQVGLLYAMRAMNSYLASC